MKKEKIYKTIAVVLVVSIFFGYNYYNRKAESLKKEAEFKEAFQKSVEDHLSRQVNDWEVYNKLIEKEPSLILPLYHYAKEENKGHRFIEECLGRQDTKVNAEIAYCLTGEKNIPEKDSNYLKNLIENALLEKNADELKNYYAFGEQIVAETELFTPKNIKERNFDIDDICSRWSQIK